MKCFLLSGISIFATWMAVDTLAHRLFLQSFYKSSSRIWRPLSEMNPLLIIVVTIILMGMFLTVYIKFVHP